MHKQITQTAQWVFRSNRPTRVINYTIQAITPSWTVKVKPKTEMRLKGDGKFIWFSLEYFFLKDKICLVFECQTQISLVFLDRVTL